MSPTSYLTAPPRCGVRYSIPPAPADRQPGLRLGPPGRLHGGQQGNLPTLRPEKMEAERPRLQRRRCCSGIPRGVVEGVGPVGPDDQVDPTLDKVPPEVQVPESVTSFDPMDGPPGGCPSRVGGDALSGTSQHISPTEGKVRACTPLSENMLLGRFDGQSARPSRVASSGRKSRPSPAQG